MTAVVTSGPNADVVVYESTRVEDYRRAWKAVERTALADIDKAFADLEEDALAAFRADDERPGRWRRLPSNLGHLLDLAAGAAESAVAAAELDLRRARRALRATGTGDVDGHVGE